MPIYEFYCEPCHTVFGFFSSRIDTASRPACPACGRAELPRKPSSFATLALSRSDEDGAAGDGDPFAGIDDSRLEGAMETLMRELPAEGAEDDPRAMGQMMRRFSQLTGLQMGERMEELVGRIEAGEDPESLEQELGAADDSSLEEFFRLGKALESRRAAKPEVDDTLYFL